MLKAAKKKYKKLKAMFIASDSSEESVDPIAVEHKRDPARKRAFSSDEEPLSPAPPTLKRRMSNSEKQIDFLNGWHVNQAIGGKVNLQTPGQPDHTYNAVGFNIYALPTENVIILRGFGVEGMLMRMRVYMIRNTPCEEHREDIREWEKIYDQKHKPSWHEPSYIMFEEPVIITPGDNVAFYVHSNCQDDRGLKYRSCRRGIVHTDDFIAVTKGFAHTSPVPFDAHHGWFRENRVLSGQILYEAVPIRWTDYCHEQFPQAFQDAVDVIRQEFECWGFNPGLIDDIVAMCPYGWFGEDTNPEDFIEDLTQKFDSQSRRFGRTYMYYDW